LNPKFDTGEVFELVELEDFSCAGIRMYSIAVPGDPKTLFDYFVDDHKVDYKEEIEQLKDHLEVMGLEEGLRPVWYRGGQGGPGFCYFFDHPDKLLRLYFLLIPKNANDDYAVILFGGGHKPADAHALQQVAATRDAHEIMKRVAYTLFRLFDKEILLKSDEGFTCDDQDELIFEIE
jgi:hypothetical protein